MPELREAITKFNNTYPVVLYMKGTKVQPQCGFSNTCVQILNDLQVPFETVRSALGQSWGTLVCACASPAFVCLSIQLFAPLSLWVSVRAGLRVHMPVLRWGWSMCVNGNEFLCVLHWWISSYVGVVGSQVHR